MIKFNMKYVEKDSTGYYYVRWDRAKKITVIANSIEEAEEKVRKIIGKPKWHDSWIITVESIEEVEE